MRDYQVKPIAALGRGLETLLALQQLRGATLHELHQGSAQELPGQ